MFCFSFPVQLKNKYADEDNGFLGFMIVAVSEEAKDETAPVGKFFVSDSIKYFNYVI
jgi:hypothetical protein